MGRKPNQLVLEYFDRGAKLEDNSNRYVQTCKACGKSFPKGRVETLITHIEKNCVSIKREDRMRILSQAVPSPQPVPHQNGNGVNPLDFPRSLILGGDQALPAVSSGRSLTGLEALAEASRQLEHPLKRGTSQTFHGPLIDPDLEGGCSIFGSSDLGRALTVNDNYTTHHTTGSDESYAFPLGAIGAPPAASAKSHPSTSQSQDPARLSLIAASASDLEARLPSVNGEPRRDQEQIIQPQAFASQQSVLSKKPSLKFGSKDSHCPVEGPTGVKTLPSAPGPLPNRPHIKSKREHSPSGHIRVVDKLQGRAQKVRALNVSGLFCKVASHHLERRREQNIQEWGECFIEFASGDTISSPLSFMAKLDRRKESEDLERPDLDVQTPTERIICIHETTDQTLSKLLPFMQSNILHTSYREPPLLSSPTFGAVLESEDKLLAQSFNLWSLTQVIVSSPEDWDISLQPSNFDPNHKRKVPGRAEGPCESNPSTFHSCHTVTTQLKAAAEQGACDISKSIMVELEKRLERKERCQGFETFFVGIILLNCIERMSWAMRKASLTEEAQDV
ncbi:MAG: hypothetical protein Q9226_007630 [Calogaya cf. arnoldii]